MTAKTLNTVDLTGAKIGNEFRIYRPSPIHWKDGAHLILRDAQCRVISDSEDAWPWHISLRGFRYERFSVGGPDNTDPMAVRPSKWFIAWLNKQSRYNADSYRQLAHTFRELGLKAKANDVLYAGKRQEHRLMPFMAQVNTQVLRATIGYGYRLSRAFWWCVFFVIIGAIIFKKSGCLPRNSFANAFSYSFDMLLPAIKLKDSHYDIEINNCYQYYLYFHKMVGFILASFLLAALSGITDL